ncbi:MAG: hypothetical protein QOG55_2592 [Acidobacteriaceae bacterium]|jgi:hypothetical protein|nr:hypothetical protein [Acidobacteriaceae bacterium]
MTQESITFASSPFLPIAIGFFGLGTATSSGVDRFFSVIPKPAPKSIAPWAYGVSGCRVFANSSPEFISWWD